MPAKREPVDGICCACGAGEVEEETECPSRDDKTHCNHWWDGPPEGDDDADA